MTFLLRRRSPFTGSVASLLTFDTVTEAFTTADRAGWDEATYDIFDTRSSTIVTVTERATGGVVDRLPSSDADVYRNDPAFIVDFPDEADYAA